MTTFLSEGDRGGLTSSPAPVRHPCLCGKPAVWEVIDFRRVPVDWICDERAPHFRKWQLRRIEVTPCANTN